MSSLVSASVSPMRKEAGEVSVATRAAETLLTCFCENLHIRSSTSDIPPEKDRRLEVRVRKRRRLELKFVPFVKCVLFVEHNRHFSSCSHHL